MNNEMRDAYLEAVAFTEFGDEGQPPKDAEFSDLAKAQAWVVCSNFLRANADLIDDKREQAAHDIWLTRNGHGVGFWDRPEIYGEEAAKILTRCAQCLGETSVYVGDDGLVYFE